MEIEEVLILVGSTAEPIEANYYYTKDYNFLPLSAPRNTTLV